VNIKEHTMLSFNNHKQDGYNERDVFSIRDEAAACIGSLLIN